MNVKDLLRFRLDGSFSQIRQRVESIADDEWDRRAIPGTSKVGFVPWHCARTLDWAVNRVAAGRAEVADEAIWRERLGVDEGLFGAGIADSTADSLPRRVDRATLLAYVADVRASALSWLESIESAELARHTDLGEATDSTSPYRRPEVWAEIKDLSGIPLWQFLSRPAISHIRVHMGEVDALLAALRASTSIR